MSEVAIGFSLAGANSEMKSAAAIADRDSDDHREYGGHDRSCESSSDPEHGRSGLGRARSGSQCW